MIDETYYASGLPLINFAEEHLRRIVASGNKNTALLFTKGFLTAALTDNSRISIYQVSYNDRVRHWTTYGEPQLVTTQVDPVELPIPGSTYVLRIREG